MYWQYTTAAAGAGVKVTPASPRRTLAAIPATVTDFTEKRLLGCMVVLLLYACDMQVVSAASGTAEHKVSCKGGVMLT
jgi:hypothetical protein